MRALEMGIASADREREPVSVRQALIDDLLARDLPEWVADALEGLPRHAELVDLRAAERVTGALEARVTLRG